uniref:NSs protein n=1 Tax=melon severe mosaic virus TaxID=485724 RepID=A9QW68_9VIRU|nr:NSs protein [melon severe mosaic virus]
MSSSCLDSIVQSKASVWGTSVSGKSILDTYWIHDYETGKPLLETQLYSDSRSKSSFCYTNKVDDIPIADAELVSDASVFSLLDDIDFSMTIEESFITVSVCSNTVNTNGVKHQGHLKIISTQKPVALNFLAESDHILKRFNLKETDIVPEDRFIAAANRGSLSCVKEIMYETKTSNNQAYGKVNVLSPNRNSNEWIYTVKPMFNQTETNNRTVNSLAIKSLLLSAVNDISPCSQVFLKAFTDKSFKLSFWLRIPKVLKHTDFYKCFKIPNGSSNLSLTINCIPNYNNIETALNFSLVSLKPKEPLSAPKQGKFVINFSSLKEPCCNVFDLTYPQRIVHSLLEVHTSLAKKLSDFLREEVIIYTLNLPETEVKKLDLAGRTLNYNESPSGKKYFLSQTLNCLPKNSQSLAYLNSFQFCSLHVDYIRGEICVLPTLSSASRANLRLDIASTMSKSPF